MAGTGVWRLAGAALLQAEEGWEQWMEIRRGVLVVMGGGLWY